MKDNTEQNLVQAASNGDTDSFGRLCERYYSAMVAIAYSQLADRGLAEDAAQEAFFAAFRDISKLKNANHFGRWLAKISRNIASDMARARRRDKLIPIENCDSVSNDEDKGDNNVEVVRRIISDLPVKLREVIYLRYYDKMSYQQISNLLGISQEAVNGRLRRAKKLIAKKLLRKGSVEVKL
ncbi:MAG: sigma-70 family RNA polymerase sigma factor [Planctomycetes bacterium]|nr:sigma-70 family RNA polymerase sigma factor [Planctomycetota bacterium]